MELNTWEKLSADERDAFGRQMLAESFRRLEAVTRNLDKWALDATSQLAEDNAATNLFRPMSWEIHYLLSSAIDHLSVVNGFWTAQQLPPFAPYTLIRSAIESCAFGVWLQEAGTMNARLIRLLELQWDQRLNVNTYTTASGMHTQELSDWLEAVLNDTKNRRPGLKQRKINALPSITDILLKTDRTIVPRGGIDGLDAWRACSGIMHGNQQFATGLMDSRSITLESGGEGTSHTLSTSGLSMMLMPAIDYLVTLTQLVLDNSKARPGRLAAVAITGGPPPPHLHS